MDLQGIALIVEGDLSLNEYNHLTHLAALMYFILLLRVIFALLLQYGFRFVVVIMCVNRDEAG